MRFLSGLPLNFVAPNQMRMKVVLTILAPGQTRMKVDESW